MTQATHGRKNDYRLPLPDGIPFVGFMKCFERNDNELYGRNFMEGIGVSLFGAYHLGSFTLAAGGIYYGASQLIEKLA